MHVLIKFRIMRKIFTLIMACTLSMGVFAAPGSFKMDNMKLTRAEASVSEAGLVSVAPSFKPASLIKKAPFKAESQYPSDISGVYDFFFLWTTNSGRNLLNMPVTLIADDNDPTKYEMVGFMENFFPEGSSETAEAAVLKPYIGTYNPADGSLTFDANYSLFDFNNGGTVIDVHAIGCSVDDEGYLVVDDTLPVVFQMTEMGFAAETIAIYFGEKQPNGKYMGFGYAQLPEMNVINGVMTYTSTGVDQTGAMVEQESGNYIFSYPSENSIFVYNFGDYGFTNAVEFVVAADGKTATATNQVVMHYTNTSQGMDTDVYLCLSDENGDPLGSTNTITAEVGSDEYGTTLSLPMWTLVTEDDIALTYATKNTVISLMYDIDDANSAIDNIVADDANAPVEYFNLQGVKVQNPENGLYIKRQGKTVEKVVIRK